MTEESKEETDKKYFLLNIGINIWLYFLAFFTLLFGNLIPVIIFGIGGAVFIFMGVSDKVRNYDWLNSQWHHNSSSCPDMINYNGYFKGNYFNI